MKNVMIDLETMGTDPTSAIVSIGAVIFDKTEITGEFYVRINLEDCVSRGLTIDPSTVLWWMEQEEKARKEIFGDYSRLSLVDALCDLTTWINLSPNPEFCVWGNGSDFDNVILTNAYKVCKMTTPWKFCNNRCYRTMKNIFHNIEKIDLGTKHNALDDARSQALHLISIFAEMKA